MGEECEEGEGVFWEDEGEVECSAEEGEDVGVDDG